MQNNKLVQAIDLAMTTIEKVDKEHFQTLILFKAQLSGNESDNTKGLISNDDYRRVKSKIQHSFQQTIDEFPGYVLNKEIVEAEIFSNDTVSTPNTYNSSINIDNQELQKNDDMLTQKELQGYRSILDMVIDKRLFLEKELVTTYDSDKKFALNQQIKELEEKITKLKQTVSGELQKMSNTVNIGNNSAGNFVLQGISGSNVNIEIKNGLVSMGNKLDEELQKIDNVKNNLNQPVNSPTEKKKILFIYSNVEQDTQIRVDNELKKIDESFQFRENVKSAEFLIKQKPQLQPKDVVNAIKEAPIPFLVHISVHGKKGEGLVFSSNTNSEIVIDTNAVKFWFTQLKRANMKLGCLFINGCHSLEIIKEIANDVEYAIGMNTAILDQAAIAFTEGFYHELLKTANIEEAYIAGISAIANSGLKSRDGAVQHLIPEIYKDGKLLKLV
jgi:hypothetical protein